MSAVAKGPPARFGGPATRMVQQGFAEFRLIGGVASRLLFNTNVAHDERRHTAKTRVARTRAGYRIEIVNLKLQSSRLALRRIHQPLADSWTVYDNYGQAPVLPNKSE